ncbi:hypothetical protein [Sigmofec virus UA08Rod_4301]|uniref:Uncharacterized protein n=1 Tax=Sigmofec virus UA08Rod_4301 TaxID=2929398 RepID=A0A976N1S9_9VIRU|nr:hypothetical protein [Sigmofec virus UA08Rod_4301]
MRASIYKFENREKFDYLLNTPFRSVILSSNVDKGCLFSFDDFKLDKITDDIAVLTLFYHCINRKSIYVSPFLLRFSFKFDKVSFNDLLFIINDISLDSNSPFLASLNKFVKDIALTSDLYDINIVKSIQF